MAKLPDMGKMIGPLPLGAWIVVVGGGLGFAVYTRRASAPVDDGTLPSSTSYDENPGVGTGGSGQWVSLSPPPPAAGTGDPTTNEEWGIKSIRYLTGLGYPAIQVDQAVRRYLAGEQLGASEATMINVAIREVGPTPQILPPPIVGVPTTPPPPKATPARRPYTHHTVLITQNMTILAIRYPHLGRSIPDRAAVIWNANKKGITRMDGSPGILTSYGLHRGQVLVIPWTNLQRPWK